MIPFVEEQSMFTGIAKFFEKTTKKNTNIFFVIHIV